MRYGVPSVAPPGLATTARPSFPRLTPWAIVYRPSGPAFQRHRPEQNDRARFAGFRIAFPTFHSKVLRTIAHSGPEGRKRIAHGEPAVGPGID